jgi:hypothetical protein
VNASPRRARLVTVLSASLLTLVAVGAAGPATAAPAPDRSGAAACAGDDGSRAAAAARSSRGPDGSTYSLRQLRRIDADLATTLDDSGWTTARTSGLELRIPVHVHVIHDDDEHGATERQVRRQLEVLEDAYAGGQSEDAAATNFSFRLATFERVRNDYWYHATIDSRADRRMRRQLHQGDASELNLYVLSPRASDSQGTVLGWSSAPWQVADTPALDGVTVHEGSLPGGDLLFYDRGDTAVHEVGHWLGLLHTFEGGCSEPNDLVEDTPAEAVPSSTCEADKDTCSLDGLDPVHNFMDYAEDACMDMFTPGQVARMTDNWLAYRTP